MWQGVNKRRFPRVNLPCKITVFAHGEKEKFSARTENIGVGGVCVVLEKELGKLHLVDLVLDLEDGRKPIECAARVVWVVHSRAKFDIGIEFIDIKDADLARVERIVQECLKNNPNLLSEN